MGFTISGVQFVVLAALLAAALASPAAAQGPDNTQLMITDEQGVARARFTHPGAWYVKFIHMEEVTDGSATHESRWATLSFAVR